MRAVVTTFYEGAHTPTVLAFDSEAEARAFADRQITVYAGVARVVIRPVDEDDGLGAVRGTATALQMLAAAVFSGWFFIELGRLL